MHGYPRGRQVERLLVRLRHLKEGDVLEHEEIAAIIEEKVGEGPYYFIVHKALKKFFVETQGIRMVRLRCVGYQYPTGREQMQSGQHGIKLHQRGMGRATLTVTAVSDERLPDPKMRAQRDHTKQVIKQIAMMAKKETKLLELCLRPTDTPPPLRLAE